jgi:hypothetical protein
VIRLSEVTTNCRVSCKTSEWRTLECEDRSEILVQEGKVWPRMDRQNGPVSRRL